MKYVYQDHFFEAGVRDELLPLTDKLSPLCLHLFLFLGNFSESDTYVPDEEFMRGLSTILLRRGRLTILWWLGRVVKTLLPLRTSSPLFPFMVVFLFASGRHGGEASLRAVAGRHPAGRVSSKGGMFDRPATSRQAAGFGGSLGRCIAAVVVVALMGNFFCVGVGVGVGGGGGIHTGGRISSERGMHARAW